MKELILFFILGWSITSILVNGSIFDSLRIYTQVKVPILSKLLTCMQCSGFWIGFFLGILAIQKIIIDPISLFHIITINSTILLYVLTVVTYGFLNSGISVIINSLIIYFLSGDRNSNRI